MRTTKKEKKDEEEKKKNTREWYQTAITKMKTIQKSLMN